MRIYCQDQLTSWCDAKPNSVCTAAKMCQNCLSIQTFIACLRAGAGGGGGGRGGGGKPVDASGSITLLQGAAHTRAKILRFSCRYHWAGFEARKVSFVPRSAAISACSRLYLSAEPASAADSSGEPSLPIVEPRQLFHLATLRNFGQLAAMPGQQLLSISSTSYEPHTPPSSPGGAEWSVGGQAGSHSRRG